MATGCVIFSGNPSAQQTKCQVNVVIFMRIPMKMVESGPSPGTGHVGSNRGNAPEDFHGDPHEYLIIRGLGLRMVDWCLFMGGPMKSRESDQVAIHHHNKPDAW